MKYLCVCRKLPKKPNSQDYNLRYLSKQKCPIHKKVSMKKTKRYEKKMKVIKFKTQKDFIYTTGFGVMQAVGLKTVGLKAFDMPFARVISTFPTREDARSYLLEVIKTVKHEQSLGLRTKRNLDPKFEGGLDFYISEIVIVVPKEPLRKRGWQIDTPKNNKLKK